MKFEIDCAACGSNNFHLNDAQTDECVVTCADCGHVLGTMGELKERLAAEVISRSNRRDTQSA